MQTKLLFWNHSLDSHQDFRSGAYANILRLFVIVFFTLINMCCTSGDSDENKEIIESFFEKLENNESDQAVDLLFSTNKWISTDDEQIVAIKSQLRNTVNQLGKFNSYESINKTSINDNLIQYSFLAKYDRQPLRFTMVFYRASKEWQVQNFHYDYDFIDELKNIGKD